MIAMLFVAVPALAVAAFVAASRRATALAGGRVGVLHSRPFYHGLHAFLWVLILGWGLLIGLTALASWGIDAALSARIASALPEAPRIERDLVLSDAKSLAGGTVSSGTGGALRAGIAARFAVYDGLRRWLTLALVAAGAGGAAALCRGRVAPAFRARNRAEALIRRALLAMAAVAVATTLGIVLSLVFQTVGFLDDIGWRIDKFLFGTRWSPLSGVFEGEMDADTVGALPLFAGTLLVTLIAMLVAVPVGLFSAIYLADFASPRLRAVAKPMLELLAGIPTVVYGFFAAITVAPFLRDTGAAIGIEVSSQSALAAGLVMGVMIIPFISSLSDDVITAVPQSLRDGSAGLGATRAETMRQVVLPAALPGIVSAVLLGISRAIGETMIVVMAAGQGPNLTANPLDAVTTVTVQIVALITGDTEADTAAGPAFTLGFTLFAMTLLMNMLALGIVRRYREAYE